MSESRPLPPVTNSCVTSPKLSREKPLIEYLGRDPNPDEPRLKQITARPVLTHGKFLLGSARS